MRITFVLPFVHPGGGVRVVFEHAVGLEALGHSVTIIYPGPSGTQRAYGEPERTMRSLKYALDGARGNHEYVWFGKPLTVKRVPDLSPRHIPAGDIVIATSNETADWVAKYPARCGKGAYFIQDYETWNRKPELVDATWKYPLAKITISGWLRDLGKEKFGVEVLGPVPNGIDSSLFYQDPPSRPSERKNDIVMIYRSAPQKGCERGLEILRRLKAEHPRLALAFFGRDEAPSALRELGPYHQDPSQEAIRKLYSSARIFFLPSFQEGFSLTPMEATACGCAVVSTAVGGPMDMFENNQEAWLANPDDTEGLHAALTDALSKPSECDARAAAAARKLESYTWKRSTAMLEQTLHHIVTDAQK